MNNCLRNLLKFILLLQNNSCKIYDYEDKCSKPFLGPSMLQETYNTRVINLYTKNGKLFESTFYSNNVLSYSSYFRINSIDNDCCTLLILYDNNGEFQSTKETIKVKLCCIGAIKCIGDVNINL